MKITDKSIILFCENHMMLDVISEGKDISLNSY